MLRAGQGVLLLTFALLCAGVVMVNSAGVEIASSGSLDMNAVLLGRPAQFAALAVLAMLAGALAPIEHLSRLRGAVSPAPWLLLAMLLLLAAVHVPGLGREVNGARRWIAIGPVGFQPSELAKWGVPFLLAWYAACRGPGMGRLIPGVLIPMGVVGLLAALIVTEDLGTAVLIGLVGAGILVAGGARIIHLLLLVPLAGAGLVAAVLPSAYRLERLQSFLDPYADPTSAGYHMIQSMAALSAGGLAGRGLGNGIHKFGYLPEDTTDFIFAIIAEELGVMGPVLVVALYVMLLLVGLRIVRAAHAPFERLLGLGILLTLGAQTFMNLAVVTGCAPTKGIALPLISAGGTGWVLTAFSLGLLVAMDREAHHDPPPAVPRSPSHSVPAP